MCSQDDTPTTRSVDDSGVNRHRVTVASHTVERHAPIHFEPRTPTQRKYSEFELASSEHMHSVSVMGENLAETDATS
jgi:hypothetical protein